MRNMRFLKLRKMVCLRNMRFLKLKKSIAIPRNMRFLINKIEGQEDHRKPRLPPELSPNPSQPLPDPFDGSKGDEELDVPKPFPEELDELGFHDVHDVEGLDVPFHMPFA